MYKRDFFIYDCDEFTKSWYLMKFSGELMEVVFELYDVIEFEDIVLVYCIFEYIGFVIGSEEDSL